ncbi:MAG: hypothetical protein HC841_02980 [Verrucomicrobiae bacterium]|nr:hypothetical protein [Verrucomicrobiae bacterium]
MKLPIPSTLNARRSGSVLMQSIVAAAVLGVVLTGVLSYVRHQNNLVMRSQNWNSAFAAAEAGIEEAMSHLAAVGGGSRSSNGWASVTGGFMKTNSFASDMRFVTFMTSAGAPVITCTGYSRLNLTGSDLTRVIQVTTRGQSDFKQPLVARGKMTLSGQFLTDSFDSTNPLYSTNGQYTASRRRQNGHISSFSTDSSAAIDLSGQVQIYGDAQSRNNISQIKTSFSSPGAIYGTKKNGAVFPYNPKTIPSGGLTLPAGGTVSGVSYARVFPAGKYFTSSVSLSGSTKWLVQGDVELIVTKDWSQSGSAEVVLASGANLKLYIKEGTVSISGSGFFNGSGNAANLSIIGASAVGSKKGLENINFSGGSKFIGTIYAPDAKMSLSGGSGVIDMIGAAIVGEVNGSGQYQFHYDEALANGGSGGILSIASWREL